MRVVATSMYADFFHVGHLECLKMAKELGDYLLVFVDSDRKAILKKGFVFMPEEERAEIIRNIKCVDEVVVVDTPISEAIEKYSDRINIFAKGGDRTIDNMPLEEIEACRKFGIELVCGLGEKIQSSSNLIDNSSVIRPWGKYTILHQGLGYAVKRITVNPKARLSLQYHMKRNEYWTVKTGMAQVAIGDYMCVLKENESVYIPATAIHRVTNVCNSPLEFIEVQTGAELNEDDIVRLKDDYGRI